MKKSAFISLGIMVIMIISMIISALSFSASAACSTCSKEEDWSKSATSFLEGIPINETQQDYGPKAARMTSSQFEKESEDQENKATTTSAQTRAILGTAATPSIILERINADPINVTAGGAVNITALFATASEGENAGNFSRSDSKNRITASAIIRNSAGINSGNVVLIKGSENEYTGIWTARVPPGRYSISISATSLQGRESFKDALQINVLEPVPGPS